MPTSQQSIPAQEWKKPIEPNVQVKFHSAAKTVESPAGGGVSPRWSVIVSGLIIIISSSSIVSRVTMTAALLHGLLLATISVSGAQSQGDIQPFCHQHKNNPPCKSQGIKWKCEEILKHKRAK